MKLQVGMVIAIEPMITMGSYDTYVMPNRWTVVTDDGGLAAWGYGGGSESRPFGARL